MRFSRDSRKSEANLRERGFDFPHASLVFDGRTPEREDRRCDYRETRIVALGRVDHVSITLVYTERAGAGGTVRRIVSARLSNRDEPRAYESAIQPIRKG